MFSKKAKPSSSPQKNVPKGSKLKRDLGVCAIGLGLVLLALLLYTLLSPLFYTFKSNGVYIIPDNPTAESPNQFLYELAPGSQVEDSFTIYNTFWSPLKARVYGLDLQETADGAAFEPYGEVPNDVGAWIEFQNVEAGEEIFLDAREEFQVFYTLTVPTETALGEHRGGISLVYSTTSEIQDETAVAFEYQLPTILSVRVAETGQTLEPWDGQENEGAHQGYILRIVLAFIIVNSFALTLIYFIHRSFSKS